MKNCYPKLHQGDNSTVGKIWGDNSSVGPNYGNILVSQPNVGRPYSDFNFYHSNKKFRVDRLGKIRKNKVW